MLDGDGNRLAGKYYGDFLKKGSSEEGKVSSVEEVRSSFERQLQAKIQGIAARPDAAEVVSVMGRTAVFCGGTNPTTTGVGDVRVVHVDHLRSLSFSWRTFAKGCMTLYRISWEALLIAQWYWTILSLYSF